MALTKTTAVDKIEIIGDDKLIQCREATVIKEDGVEISRAFHRHVLAPSSCTVNGKDVDGTWVEDDPRAFTHTDTDLSGEPQETQDICAAVWTDAVKAAWKTKSESEIRI